jgi:hypothetical protein
VFLESLGGPTPTVNSGNPNWALSAATTKSQEAALAGAANSRGAERNEDAASTAAAERARLTVIEVQQALTHDFSRI